MRRHGRQRAVLAAAVVLCTLASTALPGAAQIATSPSPDYTDEQWNALPSEKQAAEIDALPTGGSAADPNAKLNAIAANPDPGAADLEMQAAEDGPGEEYEPGISESDQSPFSDQEFVIRNSWQELNATRRVLLQVWAGAETADILQGLVLVHELPWPAAEDSVGPIAVYRTPERLGALKLTAATGYVLSFITGSGRTGSFNLDTRQYAIDPLPPAPPRSGTSIASPSSR